MAFLTKHQSFKCLAAFHTSSSCAQVRKRFPVKPASINVTAKKLGFDKGTDMYPKYPLDEPPRLWMVTQIHPLTYRPYWEKETMKEMGLYKVKDVSIQVNGPNTNEILWSVKHLIQIQPIRFPQGIPTKDDVGFTQLKKNGEFEIYKKVKTKADSNPDVIPLPAEEDWKVVDGYRMCKNCKNRRCLKFGMCQKLWMQRGRSNIERIGPRMFNYVNHPLKKKEANST